MVGQARLGFFTKGENTKGQTMTTTFTKNKQTGNYDIIGLAGQFKSGDQVTVTKANGSTKTVTVDRVSKPFVAKFGTNEGKQCVIATIQSTRGSDSQSSGDSGWRGNGCSACSAIGDWCKSCAFDEFDN